MKRLNQKGFSLIEGLLVIIALSLIVFVGYYVWNTQQKDDKTSTNSSQASTPKETSDSIKQSDYLKVAELNIKIPVSDELKGLKYEVAPDGKTVGFTTPAFATAVGDCADPNAMSSYFKAIASVNTVSGTYDPGVNDMDVYAAFVKQFPSFYLTVGTADGGFCSGSDEAKNKVTKDLFEKLSPELKQALKDSEQM